MNRGPGSPGEVDPARRAAMLRNKRGGVSLRWLRALLDHGVEVHGQLVVCPGVNDGDVLDDTATGVHVPPHRRRRAEAVDADGAPSVDRPSAGAPGRVAMKTLAQPGLIGYIAQQRFQAVQLPVQYPQFCGYFLLPHRLDLRPSLRGNRPLLFLFQEGSRHGNRHC